MPSPRLFICLAALCLLAVGCNAPYQDPRLVDVSTPTDFSIVLRVRGDVKSHDPLREPSIQTVEPNRRLGVGRGAAASGRYPPFAHYLTHKEYDALFELVSHSHLIAEPTSPGAEAFDLGKTKATEMYDVEVTMFGRTNHYRTTPAESPPTVQLLTRLVALRDSRTGPVAHVRGKTHVTGSPLMQHTTLHFRLAFLLMAYLGVAFGCSSTPTAHNKASPLARPERLSVELYTAWKDHRYTYLNLKPGGVLGYSGGRDATQRVFKPVLTLSDAQLDALWAVIQKYGLTKAKDTMFDKAERVTYQVSISTGGLAHSFRTIDDKVPGVKELHDLLFGYQGDVSFKAEGIGGGK